MSTKSKLFDESRCEDCEQKISIADIMTRDGVDVMVCGVCSGKVDPCQKCDSHDVVFSDFGVDLCGPCKANSSPKQKRWIAEQAYNEALDS